MQSYIYLFLFVLFVIIKKQFLCQTCLFILFVCDSEWPDYGLKNLLSGRKGKTYGLPFIH